MEREAVYRIAMDLMERSPGACVATTGEAPYPFQRMMFNLRNASMFPAYRDFFADKGLRMYFSTNTSLVKTAQIKNNPYCSVYLALPDEFIGLMFGGEAEIVEDREVKRILWLDGGERYYPLGVDDPDYTVFMIKPSLVRGWHKGEPVELRIGADA